MNSDWNLSLVLAIGELLADPQQPKALLGQTVCFPAGQEPDVPV